jgi:AraC-like DNA-binding protein
MNKNEILTVLKELHNVTGFRVSLHDAECREIAAYPEKSLPFCNAMHAFKEEHLKCAECDRIACKRAVENRKSYIYECRFGLTESVSPLYNFNTLTGFLMMGQVAQTKEKAEEAIKIAASLLSEKIEITASDIPTVKENLVRSYAAIMEICARYLTLSGAVESSKPTVALRAKKYIHGHLGEKILIKDICEAVGCSKSTLISAFSREYGITVNAYITDEKLSEGERLLCGTNMSLGEITSEIGFSDQAYFSRAFTAKYGISPSRYRKIMRR